LQLCQEMNRHHIGLSTQKKYYWTMYFKTDLYSITENVFNHNACTSQFEAAYDKMLRNIMISWTVSCCLSTK
ncbi:hypothetical protein BAE44_0012608, partial [Dichanthelium oligosanthes]